MSIVRNFDSQQEYIEYSKNEQHSYSKAIGKLFDLASNYLNSVEEACYAGAKAVFTNEFAPLCYACDTIPVQHTELGRLARKNAIPIAENHFMLPRDACSMLGCLMGEYYLRRNGPINKMLTTTSWCDVQSEMVELLKYEGYQIFKYDGGYRNAGCSEERKEQLVQFMTKELYNMMDFLTDGHRVSDEKVAERIRFSNEVIDKLRKIMDLRIKKPLYVKSLAAMYLVSGYEHFYGNPEKYMEVLDELLVELQDDTIEYPHDQKYIPLVWYGGRGLDFSIFHAIDECGGAILSFSIVDLSRKYREDVPPVEAIARYHFTDMTPISSAQHIQQGVLRLAQKYNAKGVIQYLYLGCNQGGVASELMRDYLKPYGITCLTIEGSFHVGAPSGQLITRVSAFMEMLS